MANAAQAALVDRVAPRRVLVFGSVPPGGRDLDVLARDADVPALERAIAEQGFEGRDGEWVRFAGCTVEALDVVAASGWALPSGEVERLFEHAITLGGFRNLARPSPADELLVLARRLGRRPAALAARHRARIDAALAADPSAWGTARARASAWKARHALDGLACAHRSGGPVPRRMALAARREAHPGPSLAAARSVMPSLSASGAIVAVSGMDGSGKSTQAEALAATLRELGHDVVVEWSRITYDANLQLIARPVKLALAVATRLRGRAPRPPADDPSTRLPRTPEDAAARALRARYPLLNQVWAAVVATVHAGGQRRTLRRHMRHGRVVVRDRYVLDSAVALRQHYGHRYGVGLAIGLLRWISPPSVAGFWLDVPAEVAYARKPEQFPLERLAARRPLYEAELERLGAIRLDGTRPLTELCEEIARETWRRLP